MQDHFLKQDIYGGLKLSSIALTKIIKRCLQANLSNIAVEFSWNAVVVGSLLLHRSSGLRSHERDSFSNFLNVHSYNNSGDMLLAGSDKRLFVAGICLLRYSCAKIRPF